MAGIPFCNSLSFELTRGLCCPSSIPCQSIEANYTPVFLDFQVLQDFTTTELQPEEILERRLVRKGSKAVPQVRVKWLHLPQDSTTWEDWYVLQQRFPSLVARGQVTVPAGGPVTPSLPDVPHQRSSARVASG